MVSTPTSGRRSVAADSPAWCAVTTTNDRATPRAVTGIPAAAGPAIALETPGTTSHGTPAARHASSSSLPRPNTNGSPPLSRTTVRPALACCTSSSLISSCVSAAWPRPLPTSISSAPGPSLLQQCGADQPVVHDDVGPSQELEAARRDEPRITGAGAHQVHRPLRDASGVRAAPAQARARRWMAAGQVHDDVHDAGKRADRLVHHDPRASLTPDQRQLTGLEPDGSRHVLRRVAAAADQERDDDHGVRADLRQCIGQPGLVIEEGGHRLARHAAATQRLRELEGGLAARRMAKGPVTREQHRRLRPAERVVPQQLAHPSGHQRRDPRMRADRRGDPEPHRRMTAVSRQRLRQHLVGVVPGAGHHRHHRDRLGLQLVEHGVEPGLALVEGDGDLCEQAALAHRLRQPAHQRVGGGVPARAVGRQNQRPAHEPTASATSSALGSSRPEMEVRRSVRPTSRW